MNLQHSSYVSIADDDFSLFCNKALELELLLECATAGPALPEEVGVDRRTATASGLSTR